MDAVRGVVTRAAPRLDHGDPATTARRFVIAAPDFLATLLMPALLDAAAREAPGTSVEIVPSSRRGDAWLLETGDVDLAVGAIVDEAPGVRRVDLLTEGFARAARKGHPSIDGALDLRHVAARVRYFMAAPLIARSFGLKERPRKRSWCELLAWSDPAARGHPGWLCTISTMPPARRPPPAAATIAPTHSARF